jgi:hypothetical protein
VTLAAVEPADCARAVALKPRQSNIAEKITRRPVKEDKLIVNPFWIYELIRLFQF